MHNPYGLFFQFCFIFTEGEKRRKLTNCDNGSCKSLLSHGLDSFPITIPHKISGGLNVFSYLIVINHFVFILELMKWPKGNLFNPNNFHFDSVSIFTL